jgi:trk system potassium uptake protein TrkH
MGGIGVITAASFVAIITGRRLGVSERLQVTQAVGGSTGTAASLVITVIAYSLAFEFAGFLALTVAWWSEEGARAPYLALFHAVSAFNNAGFSLYPDNLIGWATDPWLLLPACLAVIVGGIGFPVWIDLRRRLRRPSAWSVHTKLTLLTTAILLAFGTALLTALEWNNPKTLGALGWGDRLLGGFTAGVMPRTAGFNAIDYADAGDASLLVTDMLMFAGGGSGSTAGGIKVTTLAVLTIVVWSELRGDRDPTAFRRRMPRRVVRQALTVAALSVNVVVVATLALIITEDLPLSAALFECVSAFATVGLSAGVTPGLGIPGQAILMVLMLMGRVGPLTLFVALVLRERDLLYRHPEGQPLVG